MGKKKLSRHVEEGSEDNAPAELHGIKRKRICAGTAVGHPCPGETPSRKKKSLSQFASPSPNSKKRMEASIAAARETKKRARKPRVDVGIPVPVISSRAFEHVLALDAVLRAAGETRVNCPSGSPNLPSEVRGTHEQHSPASTTIADQGQRTRDQGTVQGSEVHVHIYVTPPRAQTEQRHNEISVDPLVRARRILEFSGGPESSPGGPHNMVLTSDRKAPIPVEQENKVAESPTEPVHEEETVAEDGVTLPILESAGVLPQPPEVVHCEEQPGNNRVLVSEVGDDSTPRSPCGGLHMQIPNFSTKNTPENELNCTTYGEEREADLPSVQGPNFSREFVDRLLSLLPHHEREEFLRTHPLAPPSTPLAGLTNKTDTVDENREVQAAAALGLCGEPDPRTCFPSCEALVTPSTRSSDIQKERIVTEEQFQKTLRELARDERKYKKKQAKKLVRQEKGKKQTSEVTEKLIAKTSVVQKPPLVPGRVGTSSVGPNSRVHAKKDTALSSGGSSGTPSSSAAVGTGDSLGVMSSWDAVFPIPPFQVNSLTAPIGEFWEHMRRHALDQAPFEFPWHLDWNKQCPKLKARFTLMLRKIYPGPWDAKSIMRAVGANLRERRTRLKRKFEKAKRCSQVAKPAGCSKGSWLIIYESTKDAKKQKKAKLCKAAADKRFKVQGPTHRCGPRGIKGLHDRFVDLFKRPPTDEELEYGKINGWVDLRTKVEKTLELLEAQQAPTSNCQGGLPMDHAPSTAAAKDHIEISSSPSTSNSDDSQSSSSDGDSSASEAEEE